MAGLPTSGTAGTGTSQKKKECFNFEPQQWRKTVCRNCFRLKSEHNASSGPIPLNENEALSISVGMSQPMPQGGNDSRKHSTPTSSPTGRRALINSATSQHSANSPNTGRSPTEEKPGSVPFTILSGNGTKNPVAAPSSSPRTSSHRTHSGSARSTPTPTSVANSAVSSSTVSASGKKSPSPRNSSSPSLQHQHSHSGVGGTGVSHSPSQTSVDARYVEELENDFFDLEDKYDAMVKEKEELQFDLQEKIRTSEELRRQVDEYRAEVASLDKRSAHLEEEVRTYRERLRLPESDQQQGSVVYGNLSSPSDDHLSVHDQHFLSGENVELRHRLEEVEQLCQELMEENEVLKEEVEEMQREIEEMHDHFHDEDTDTLRDLQRELEAANKNCRIFQFKLRKAERRYEQCDAERAALEEKLNRLEQEMYNSSGAGGDISLLRQLEEQLRNAQEVSIRLNSELELQDERKQRFEGENRQLKNELHSSESRRIQLENELGRLRLEMDKIRTEGGSGEMGPLQVTDKTHSRNRLSPGQSLSREPSFEEQQLQRELEATKERETDLSEILRATEDEVRKLKRRLDEVEDENDTLTRRLEAFLSKGGSLKITRRDPNGAESDSDFDEEDFTNMKIQLLEEETSILRKKIISLEKENQLLTDKVNSLTKELICVSRRSEETNMQGTKHENEEKQLREEVLKLREELNKVHEELERVQKENHDFSQQLLSVSTSSEPIRGCAPSEGALREFDKRLRQVTREVSIRCNTQDTIQKEMFDKYQESCDTVKEQAQQLTRFRTRISEVQEENTSLKQEVDTLRKKVGLSSLSGRGGEGSVNEGGRSGGKKPDLTAASREFLMEEISSLEEEIDELDHELKEVKVKVHSLQQELRSKDDLMDEQKSDFDRKEQELLEYIGQLESKNSIITNLLDIVQIRADELQEELDEYVESQLRDSENVGNEANSSQQNTALASQKGAAPVGLSGESVGSDEVFASGKAGAAKSQSNVMQDRIRSLERLLNEERARTRAVEKQLEMTMRDTPRSRVIGDTKLKDKEIELLKKEIDEKEELLEEMADQVNDLKQRLDQTRKMNDCLRALVDKDDEADERTVVQLRRAKTTASPQSDTEGKSKQHELELNSFKMELDSSRKELNQLNVQLKEVERTRDRLAKENKLLQEELKIRDITIQEQEDELREKGRELYQYKTSGTVVTSKLNSNVEESDNSQKRRITELESQVTQWQQNYSVKEKEQTELTETLHHVRNQLSEKQMELTQTESQMRGLNEAIRLRDDRLNEKDQLLEHMNQRLLNREKELSQLDLLLRETQTKLSSTENRLRDLSDRLITMEQEKKALYMQAEESAATVEKQKVEIQALRNSVSSLSKEKGTLRQEKDDEIVCLQEKLKSAELSASSSQASSKLSQEIEDLKKEIHKLQFDKARNEKEWQKERNKLLEKISSATAAVTAVIPQVNGASLATKPPPIPSEGRVKAPMSAISEVETPQQAQVVAQQGINRLSPSPQRSSNTTEHTNSTSTLPRVKERQSTKVNMLTDHVSKLNRMNIELKLQNEALQRDMLEYQQKYRNVKQEHEIQLESWIKERAELEVNIKELEHNNQSVVNARASLEETLNRLTEVELKYHTEKLDAESKLEQMEKEKETLQAKLSQYEQQQKLPKVLQRFSGTSARVSVSAAAGGLLSSAEVTQLQVKLEKEEKNSTRIRQEMREREEEWASEKRKLMQQVINAQSMVEKETKDWQMKCSQLETYRQQKEALLQRLSQLEESQERERRAWLEERMQLQIRCEEMHYMAEQWWDQLQFLCKEANENGVIDKKGEDSLQSSIKEVIADMEKCRHMGEKAPYVHMKRSRLTSASDNDTVHSEDRCYWLLQGSTSELSDSGSLPCTPFGTINISNRPWPNQSTGGGSVSAFPLFSNLGSRTASIEWGSSTNHQGPASTIGIMTAGVGPSYASSILGAYNSRCQTPEPVGVKKVTSYPDPTPGFLLRSAASVTNVALADQHGSSVGGRVVGEEYTSQNFTAPGNRGPRQRGMSPAKQMFLQSYDQKITRQSASEARASSTPTTTSESHVNNRLSEATSAKASHYSTLNTMPTVKVTPVQLSSNESVQVSTSPSMFSISTSNKAPTSKPVKTVTIAEKESDKCGASTTLNNIPTSTNSSNVSPTSSPSKSSLAQNKSSSVPSSQPNDNKTPKPDNSKEKSIPGKVTASPSKASVFAMSIQDRMKMFATKK